MRPLFLQLVSAPLNIVVVERHLKASSPTPQPNHKSVSTVTSLERGHHQGNVILRYITNEMNTSVITKVRARLPSV